MVLGLIAGLIILSWAVRFTQSLFAPLKASSIKSASDKKYIWNGEFNINLLVRTPVVSVVSYSPKEEKITIISIPDETFLDVPHGFGKWQLRAVYDLGRSQDGIGGDKLLSDTVASFLAIPIDGFLDLSSLKKQKSAVEMINTIRANPFSGFGFLSSLKTNLTMWELLKLFKSIGGVRFDKVKELDFAKLNVLEKDTLADGTPIFTADPIKLDSVLASLADPAVVTEHKSIAILNATDHPQLAQKWARVVTNLGGNVIITTNANTRLKMTQVTGEQSPTLKRLRQIFDLGCQNNPKCDTIKSSDEDIVSSRAQINLLLGEDYFLKENNPTK